jgi:hypothetical protein
MREITLLQALKVTYILKILCKTIDPIEKTEAGENPNSLLSTVLLNSISLLIPLLVTTIINHNINLH